MAKILHIMPMYTTRPYHMISFIKRYFHNDEHTFLIMATKDEVISRNPRLLAFPELNYMLKLEKKRASKLDRLNDICKYIENADFVVWHSFLPLKGMLFLPRMAKKKYSSKFVWIKCYSDIFYIKKRFSNPKTNFLHSRQYKARKNVLGFGYRVESEYQRFIRHYGDNAVFSQISFPMFPHSYDVLLSQIEKRVQSEKRVVLVGVNGRPYNNHCNIIRKLSCLTEGSVILPMNLSMLYEYGIQNSASYIRNVRACCKRSLSVPFAIISKSAVSAEQYFKTLDSVSAAVFSGTVPISLDIIQYLFALGKKVFVPEKTELMSDLEEMGYIVYDWKKAHPNDAEFFELSDEEREHNRALALNQLSDEYVYEQWDELFTLIKQRLGV